MLEYAFVLLITHAVWDLVMSIAIWQSVACQQCCGVASVYLGTWTDEADRTNFAAGILLSFLVMHWSFMRMLAALSDWGDIAVWTYFMQGSLVLFLVFAGRMRKRQGCVGILVCSLCSLLVTQGD
jgi:hypothetical protein